MKQVFEREFEVVEAATESVPAENEIQIGFGRHLNGCRIGFDLGASDYKNGEVVYTKNFPGTQVTTSDPRYHYGPLNSGLKKAAAHTELHVPDEKKSACRQAAANLPMIKN